MNLLRIHNDTTVYYIVIPTLILIVLYLLDRNLRSELRSIHNWRQYFDMFSMSGQEFYERVKEKIQARDMPHTKFSTTAYFESSIFSEKREYLRITRGEYIIDVCAASFGKSCFISYWLVAESPGLFERTPIIKTLFGIDPAKKSYYQMDTEQMFLDCVHSCIMSVVNEVSHTKGLREVNELGGAKPANYVHAEPKS